jgi:hypothetical protein
MRRMFNGGMMNKKYNLTITPMWETKNQNLMSIEITEDILQALDKVEVGGKLFIKRLEEDRRKNDKSPHAYLEYLDPSEVAAYKAKQSPSKSKFEDSL